MPTAANYETVGVQNPGTMTTVSSPSWTQCQGSATSMAYKSMMDLQTLLVNLQEYWQEMIQQQSQVAAASAKISANATIAAANDAADMLVCQSAAAAGQAGVALFEGAYGFSANKKMEPAFEEAQAEQTTLNRLDKNLAEADEASDSAGNTTTLTKTDENAPARQQELLNGRNSFYDNDHGGKTAKSQARKKESNTKWYDENAADKLDKRAIDSMTPEQRTQLNENLREERGNNSRKLNNLNTQLQLNMQKMQLTGTIINQGIQSIDKGVESIKQTEQGEQQAIEKLAQSNQQMASQAASEANKNKDALAQEASKALDTLSALAQCSRAV
ncbi:MAG: hypothetical protein FJZ57_05430 [Chlamydiae bacterium]|nr:hypothetical protein [Chlamydiota bacterium]